MEQHRILNRIVKATRPLPGVLAVVLYGSFARGDYGPKSDVDLLILVNEPDQVHPVEERLAEQEFGRQIQPMVRTLGDLAQTDTGLLRNVFREGRLLFLNGPLDLPAFFLLDLKPFALYTFTLKGLAQPDKARFNRILYPHRTRGYPYRGLLAELGGTRVTSGCFLLPQGSRHRVERAFRKHRVDFQSRQVWL